MNAAPDIDRGRGRTLFGVGRAFYDEARPEYPAEVYETLASRCGLEAGSRVFEVGAGTGQVTERLAQAGARVAAIEPDPELAGLLSEKVEGRFQEVSVDAAPFEDASLPTASFDIGVAATSFHWIDPAVGLQKARDLLVPGGWWAMWWNVFMDSTRPDPFYEATREIMAPLGRSPSAGATGRPPFALDVERRKAELEAAGLSDTGVETIRWTARLDTARTRALYATFSPISQLPADERERVLDAIATVAEDTFEGCVERPFQTVLYTSQRVAPNSNQQPAT